MSKFNVEKSKKKKKKILKISQKNVRHKMDLF